MLIIAASDILTLLPNFTAGCQKLHDLLIPVAAVMCGAGLTIRSLRVIGGNPADIGWHLLRLAIVVILCFDLGTWSDAMNDGVWDLLNQTGFAWSGGDSGGVFHDFITAIRNKWGTNGAAQDQQALYNRVNQNGTAQTNGGSTPVNTTVHFTHYAYPGDSTPDSYSANGIGNHNNQLVAGQSVAISKNIADQYGLTVGETVQFTTADGRTITGVYDDTPGNWPGTSTPIDNVVDMYDPSGQYASLSGVGITGINGMGVQNTGVSNFLGNALGWLGRIPEMTWMAFWSGLVWLMATIAAGCLWLLEAVRQMLYCVEIAISPLFLGMLMIPATAGIASRYFSFLAAVIIWPIGAAVCDLLTKAIIDLAVNPTGNIGQQIALSLGGLGIWAALAVWVAFSSFAVPVVAHKLMVGGGSGIGGLVGTAFGMATASQAQRTAHKSAVMAASAMRSATMAINGARQNLPSTNGNGSRTPIGISPTTSNNERN
jgi:hypothetical protein